MGESSLSSPDSFDGNVAENFCLVGITAFGNVLVYTVERTNSRIYLISVIARIAFIVAVAIFVVVKMASTLWLTSLCHPYHHHHHLHVPTTTQEHC